MPLFSTLALLFAAGPPLDYDELRLIPADARAFVSARVAALWSSSVVRKGLAEAKKSDPKSADPAARLEQEFGLRPEAVERAVGVLPRAGAGWVAVRTRTPYDRRKTLARLRDARPALYRGQTYHTGTDRHGRKLAVWPASPRVLVAGPEDGVRACIAVAADPVPEGPLRPALLVCREEPEAVVGVDPERFDLPKDNRIVSYVAPLGPTWATVRVGGGVVVTLRTVAVDDEHARRLERVARVSLILAAETLAAVLDVSVAQALSSLGRRWEVARAGRSVLARTTAGGLYEVTELALLACGSEDGIFKPQAQVRSPHGAYLVEGGLARAMLHGRVTRWYTRRLVHGCTMWGKQFLEEDLLDVPLAYYTRSGPVGQVFRAYNTDPERAVAVLDLGVGTMAAHGLRGQAVDFYERDAELSKLCFDTDKYFTYVADARRRGVKPRLILGDPRKTFPTADRKYRLIVVDCLNPDALPGSLTTKITREAVKGYFDRLEPDGIVMVHISDRFFDLQPVLANLADDLGVVGYQLSDDDEGIGGSRSHWVALARKAEHLTKLPSAPRWTRDEDQLTLLAVAGTSPGLVGMALAGRALADEQARRAHREEGRPGDGASVATGWRPLETTAELRRLLAAGPKEVRALEERIGRLGKEAARGDAPRKAWLEERIESLKADRDRLRTRVERAAGAIRRNARVGVWTDGSSDLVEVFIP